MGAKVKVIRSKDFSDKFMKLCDEQPDNDKVEYYGEIMLQHNSGVTLFKKEWCEEHLKLGYPKFGGRILIPMPSSYCILIEFIDR